MKERCKQCDGPLGEETGAFTFQLCGIPCAVRHGERHERENATLRAGFDNLLRESSAKIRRLEEDLGSFQREAWALTGGTDRDPKIPEPTHPALIILAVFVRNARGIQPAEEAAHWCRIAVAWQEWAEKLIAQHGTMEEKSASVASLRIPITSIVERAPSQAMRAAIRACAAAVISDFETPKGDSPLVKQAREVLAWLGGGS